ncbi:MAG TPA: hypothetical protein VFE06_07130 [Acidobacteriaceae bacterium]|nr:hypothetical protein [Acidobacteriaceae bacterium]
MVAAALLGLVCAAGAQAVDSGPTATLPDAPSALLAAATPEGDAAQNESAPARPRRLPLCPTTNAASRARGVTLQGPPPCQEQNPIQPIVIERAAPLTSNEKGKLALRDFIDPFNLATIATYSAVAIGSNSHSPYGPGWAGFGRLTGYGLAQDAQGEFLETYAIPSLVHEDPRYHRMPTASIKRRIGHAIEHTFVSQHDDGRPMPNYATLLTYPIGAEISDEYVPGIQTDIKSTGRRVALGIATDPAGALVAEFLPDVAKRIHIHIVFVQEILNRMVVGAPSTQ